MNGKRYIGLVWLSLLVMICAGCRSGDASDQPVSATNEAGVVATESTLPGGERKAQPVPNEVRQLTLAIGGEEESGYDPTLGWGRYGSPLFQSTLLRRDENLEIVNDLAESYQVSDDGRSWAVAIRQDVLFSDGEPLTASDVAYTFNSAATSGGLTDLTVLEEAVATGEYDVEFRLKEAQGRLALVAQLKRIKQDISYGRHSQ